MTLEEIRSLIRIYDAGGEIVVDGSPVVLPGRPHTGVWTSGPGPDSYNAYITLTQAGMMLAKSQKENIRRLVKMLRARREVLRERAELWIGGPPGHVYRCMSSERVLASSEWYRRTADRIEGKN